MLERERTGMSPKDFKSRWGKLRRSPQILNTLSRSNYLTAANSLPRDQYPSYAMKSPAPEPHSGEEKYLDFHQ